MRRPLLLAASLSPAVTECPQSDARTISLDPNSHVVIQELPEIAVSAPVPDGKSSAVDTRYEVVIGAPRRFGAADLHELWSYRDLLTLLTWRTVRVRYAQSAVGLGWALIQPLFQMVIFTLLFGRLANLQSDGVSYAAFSLVGLIPWTYFANAVQGGAGTLVTNAAMISKVYFPRLVLPMTEVGAKLFDFLIALVVGLGVILMLGAAPNWGVLMLPYLVLLMTVTALGVSLWLATLAVQYRDINHAMGFLVQLMLYANPVIYSTSMIPESWTLPGGWTIWPRAVFALNPMVGVIEGFRSALLGTRPMPFGWIALGTVTSLITLVTGLRYFRRRERLIADVT
ncbi:Teichoic acid translocation permease protein TagG [Caulifigura coniformis]|uniref:Transport permease protein n=1 Tax=Caulifigura coniformis TaxID=2527983 RepID=A0A517SIB6_9PLAN|nr:ABC transporter permease [Caulifigura coniformis]QDT55852.1 Teichoic acid translocation permease protein TagG [Caulifigura coniformis]